MEAPAYFQNEKDVSMQTFGRGYIQHAARTVGLPAVRSALVFPVSQDMGFVSSQPT